MTTKTGAIGMTAIGFAQAIHNAIESTSTAYKLAMELLVHDVARLDHQRLEAEREAASEHRARLAAEAEARDAKEHLLRASREAAQLRDEVDALTKTREGRAEWIGFLSPSDAFRLSVAEKVELGVKVFMSLDFLRKLHLSIGNPGLDESLSAFKDVANQVQKHMASIRGAAKE